jgi:hypothetical protein
VAVRAPKIDLSRSVAFDLARMDERIVFLVLVERLKRLK